MLEVEGKVELPRCALGRVAVFVAKRQAELDDPQHVDVTPHRLEVVIGPRLEVAYWSGYYAWELRVLCVSGETGGLTGSRECVEQMRGEG